MLCCEMDARGAWKNVKLSEHARLSKSIILSSLPCALHSIYGKLPVFWYVLKRWCLKKLARRITKCLNFLIKVSSCFFQFPCPPRVLNVAQAHSGERSLQIFESKTSLNLLASDCHQRDEFNDSLWFSRSSERELNWHLNRQLLTAIADRNY